MKNSKLIKILIIVSVLLVLGFGVNFLVYKKTDYNFITNTTKTLLNNLGIYTEEVNELEISSNNETKDYYSYFFTEFSDKNKITLGSFVQSDSNLEAAAKDYVFMVDTTVDLFSPLSELMNYIFQSNPESKITLIAFNKKAYTTIKDSSDINEIYESLNSIEYSFDLNYNNALLNLDEYLSTYQKQENRELEVVFITDGLPTEDVIKSQITYQKLKEKYSYLEINAFQYEMGETVKSEVKNISDAQYVYYYESGDLFSSEENFIYDMIDIFKLSSSYEEFKVEMLISEYFDLENASEIENSYGNISIETLDNKQKISWDLGSYYLGLPEYVLLNLNLKEEYQNKMDYYPVTEKITVTSKLKDQEQEIKTSDLDLVLKNYFEVNYNTNEPDGCSVDRIDSEKHVVFDKVNINDIKLSCDGYTFKGWKVNNDNVDYINDNTFIMPSEDVEIVANWAKQSITKSMDGTIYIEPTLYNVLKYSEGTYTSKYSGSHQDSYTKDATHDIYHYYASDSTTATEILDSNNVIFASHCWQMIRTTDTGGVKLIYNGEPDSNGSCGTDRGTHVGYSGTTNQTLSSSYYYGTDYTYDSSTSIFSLSGTKTLATWSDSTYSDLIGKYTCLSAEEDGTCTTLYLVESYVSNSQAKTIKIVSTSSYFQFGTVPFNSNYNSPAYVGYMYGDVYTYSAITKANTINYHYGESVTYDGEEYTLVNPKTFTSTPAYTDISNNHYICLIQNTDKCDKVGYVYYYSGSKMYYITLNVGETDVNTALNNMLTKNTTSSTMKNAIDAWYEKNLLEYDEYIEQDAIYCNDRSIKALNGWNPKGGLTNGYLQFKEYSVTKDLSCTNNTDKFSVSNTSAKLKYPIGLATSPEMNLLNNATLRKTGSWYWPASPSYFYDDNAYVRYVNLNGSIGSNRNVSNDGGVRPAVSLVSGTRYSSGDGSASKPYIVE